MIRSLLGLALFVAVLAQASGERCGGGDGPKPFNDISTTMPYRVEPMDTKGGVKEFFVWEGSDTIVYRNSRNEVRGLKETSQGNTHSLYTTSQFALDRASDPREGTILMEGVAWLFDRFNRVWLRFSSINPMNHLFFNDRSVYGYSTKETPEGKRYSIYRYQRYLNGAVTNICTVHPTKGMELKLGHGHRFPEMVFYSTKPAGDGDDITIQLLNVEKCRFEIFERRVTSPTVNVYWFQQLASFAIQVDHPRSNLLWWTPLGCDYFDIAARTPIILNYDQPVVATWNPNKDVSLYFLNSANTARLLTGLPIKDLGENDLWMSSNGHDVYMSPLFEGERNKWLLKVDLNSPH